MVSCLSSSFSTWSLPSSLSWASLSSCPLGRCRPARCALSCCSLCSCHFEGFGRCRSQVSPAGSQKTRKAGSQHPNVPSVTWAQRGSILIVSVRLPRLSPCPVGAIIASKCPHHKDDRAEHVATAGHRRTHLCHSTLLRCCACLQRCSLSISPSPGPELSQWILSPSAPVAKDTLDSHTADTTYLPRTAHSAQCGFLA